MFSISELCCMFCCPPCPGPIAAKLAFQPPEPTYKLTPVDDANVKYNLHFFDRAEWQFSERDKSKVEAFFTRTSRGNLITCIYVRCSKNAKYTLLFSHGNAVDLGQMSSFYISLGSQLNCNIFGYDYSGYGMSGGKPSEKNLYADIEAAWQAMRTRFNINPETIILYGQSIGTVPTVDLATRHEVGAVILHSPLMSGLRVVFRNTKRTWFFDAFPSSKINRLFQQQLQIVKKILNNMCAQLLADYKRGPLSGFNTKLFFKYSQTKNIGHDQTDNNTYTDLTQPLFKPRYAMNDIFHREDERLKTFDCWPLVWLDKNQLAMSGMYYMGEEDKTKCYFCEVEIGRWEREDQPVPEHLRWSPNCPLLRRRTTNNVPINCEALDRLLPPPSYDICGLNEHIEVRRNAFPEGTIPAADIPPASSALMSVCSSSGSSNTYYPEYPEYAIETARLRTFSEWPRNMKQKPAQLAEAGFFYTGVGDRVKCFSCGGGLKDWDENDEPWEQHALWMSKCRYVKLVKGDIYIETVVNRFKKSAEEGKLQNVVAAVAPASVPSANINSASVPAPTSAAVNVKSETELPQASKTEDQPSTVVCSGSEQNKKSCSNTPEEKLCKICYANEYNTAFLPCGHVVACAKCASSVTKCPLCRKPFADVMRVYFS